MGFCSAPSPFDSATAQQQAGRFARADLNPFCTHPGMIASGRQGCLAYVLPWSHGRSHVQLPGGERCPSAAGPVLQQQLQLQIIRQHMANSWASEALHAA